LGNVANWIVVEGGKYSFLILFCLSLNIPINLKKNLYMT
jgi:hypothetical protein